MKEIQLTRGYVAIVDDEDYERVSKLSWHASGREGKIYAAHTYHTGHGAKTRKVRILYMHRFLLNAPPHLQVDHKNRDKLDNRRENLRLCTRSGNASNTLRERKLSPFRGVLRSPLGRWFARITFEKKQIHLGTFSTPHEAALAYDAAARRYQGEFAVLNFPERLAA